MSQTLTTVKSAGPRAGVKAQGAEREDIRDDSHPSEKGLRPQEENVAELRAPAATGNPFLPFLFPVGLDQSEEAKQQMARTICMGTWKAWVSESIKRAFSLLPVTPRLLLDWDLIETQRRDQGSWRWEIPTT